MDFSVILKAIKNGKKASRKNWNNEFVYLVPGSTFKVSRHPLLGVYPEGKEISYHPHIDKKNEDGTHSTWTPTQEDLMAENWEIRD